MQINKTTLLAGYNFSYFSLRFDIDSVIETYERSVFSFWEFIALIGGIYVILNISFALFVGTYNSRMFILSVINKKIKVLTQQTEDEFERLNPLNNNIVGEQQQQLNGRLNSQGLHGTNARRRNMARKPIKQFSHTDCLKDLI